MEININKKNTLRIIKNYYQHTLGWESVQVHVFLSLHENSLLESVSFGSNQSFSKYSVSTDIVVFGKVLDHQLLLPIQDSIDSSSMEEIMKTESYLEDYQINQLSFQTDTRFSVFCSSSIKPYFYGISLQVEPIVKQKKYDL